LDQDFLIQEFMQVEEEEVLMDVVQEVLEEQVEAEVEVKIHHLCLQQQVHLIQAVVVAEEMLHKVEVHLDPAVRES
jgi:hypothetical protein